ncbi:hypothetical protein BBJ29_007859 [Phytophthora kernoviae]|uniref:Uncharacterized protein n=1 Tax=Phytophthora kernoviae TaxID=325452 RepID=A0A3F2RQU2_9STRA|nr:hypothetical protein BBP00_00005288 [Phytophthora kernoviae]RLN61797.1 hypothetical protein BBJ29_007859 [Phytophthora kernoviae]
MGQRPAPANNVAPLSPQSHDNPVPNTAPDIAIGDRDSGDDPLSVEIVAQTGFDPIAGTCKLTRRIGIPAEYITHVAALIYQQLLDGIEVSCREIDDVFKTQSPVYSNLLMSGPLLRDEVNGMYLELFDSKIMPFDMHTTGEA